MVERSRRLGGGGDDDLLFLLFNFLEFGFAEVARLAIGNSPGVHPVNCLGFFKYCGIGANASDVDDASRHIINKNTDGFVTTFRRRRELDATTIMWFVT
jgi:hypothetical protein